MRLRALHVSIVHAMLLFALGDVDPVRAQSVTVTGDIDPVMQGSPPPYWSVGRNLYIGRDSFGSMEISDGGTVSSEWSSIGGSVGHSSGVGNVLVTGSGSRLDISTSLTIGDTGTGRLVILDGGRVSVTSHFLAIGATDTGKGEVNVEGPGSVLEAEDITIGSNPFNDGPNPDVGGEGDLTIQGGGKVLTGRGQIGTAIGTTGTVLVTGPGSYWGELDVDLIPGGGTEHLAIGTRGTGTLTIEDGGRVNALVVGLAGLVDGDAKVLLRDGGVLQAGLIKKGAGQAMLLFNDSGILQARANESNFLQNFDAGDVTLGTGGGIIDSQQFNIGIEASISGAGGLEKIGAGTLTLSGSNSYGGATDVTQGVLIVDGSIANSSLTTIRSGAKLGGMGTVGNTTVAAGGRLAPTFARPGNPLTVEGNLILEPGSFLDYTLASPGTAGFPGLSSRIDVTGDLTLNGTLNLAQNWTGDGTAGRGYYRLMTYGRGLDDQGLVLGSVLSDGGLSYQVIADNGNVDLFIGYIGDANLQHWLGGDGVWNAADATWRNSGLGAPSGDTPVSWAGHHALFKHEPGSFGGGMVTVDGPQSIKGLQFVDAGYTLAGTGVLETVVGGTEIRVLADSAQIATAITGSGGIVKTEAGTLILLGRNTYQGGTTLAGGVLSVSGNANLGHEDGGLSFDGGVLQVTGTSFTSAMREIVLGARGGGFDIADVDNTIRLGGSIRGDGDLFKRGAGTLTLSGSNDYGNTVVESGRLTGHARSISGNIANAGVVAFDQAVDDSFAGDIAGLEGVSGRMLKSGQGTLTLQGRSALDWTVIAGELATEAARFGGQVVLDGAATTLTFTDSGDVSYEGLISGNGLFSLDGGGTTRLTGDSSGFAGNTAIRAGTLLVAGADGRGALGGSLKVFDGAKLGGSGTVGSGAGSVVAVAAGAALSPGSSIGTLTIDGDLVFEPGSRLDVEVAPAGTQSDHVVVTGRAALNGGEVAHIGTDGNYALRSTYTILSAGALDGAFGNVSSDFAFLTPSLSYDYGAGTVALQLVRNDIEFASVARTRNQKATAAGIDSMGISAAHPVFDAIAGLFGDDDLIRASFDAFSGEIHASAKSALIDDSRFIRDAANERMRAAFSAPGAAPSAGDLSSSAPGSAGPVVWSHAFGSWGKTHDDGNAASLRRETGGLLLGADRQMGPWRVGLLGGYSHSSAKARDRSSSAKSDNYHLGLYGATQWDRMTLRTGAAYTWHDVDTARTVSVPGLSDYLSAGYRANNIQVFGELAYEIEQGAVRLEPFANLAYVRMHADGYDERGGAAALSGSSDSMDTTFMTLGLRAEHEMKLGAARAVLRGLLGWRHAFGHAATESTHAFSAGAAFTVAGVPIARDSAVVEAGLSLDLTPGTTFGLSYSGLLAGSAQDHGVRANLMVRF